MAVPVPDARESSDEALEALRLCAWRGGRSGLTGTRIARLLGRRA